jgi:hypothetical protein
MHLFHCHTAVLQRSKQQSAYGWAAYGGCTRFDAGGRRGDYRRSLGDHVQTFVLLPTGAPDNHVDPVDFLFSLTASETQVNAQEGRCLTVAMPRAVPTKLLPAVAAYVLAPFVSEGMAIYTDIQCPQACDGLSNSHFHALISLREIDGAGFGQKCRAWNGYFRKDGGRYFRAVVAGRLTLACGLLGLPVYLDPRSNAARGLGDPEPRLPATKWKRRQRGEQVTEIDNLVRRRSEKTGGAPADRAKRGKSPGLTLSNVVARRIDQGGRQAALAAIEGYLAGQQMAFARIGDEIRVAISSDEELLCSVGRLTTSHIVSPEIARLMVACARVLDWPAVVADGDPDSVDAFVIAGVQEELAVVNCCASDRVLSLMRHRFGERLPLAVADYDRRGVAEASVRSYRAVQFQRAMAYGPRLSRKVGDIAPSRPNIRPSAAQFQRAMAYRPALKASVRATAVAPSLPQFYTRTNQSAAQFVRSMSHGAASAGATEKTEHSLPEEAVGYRTPEIASGVLASSSAGFRVHEAPVSKKPAPEAAENTKLVSIPEIPAKVLDNRASRFNRQLLMRHRLKEEQNLDALVESLSKAKMKRAIAEKPTGPNDQEDAGSIGTIPQPAADGGGS